MHVKKQKGDVGLVVSIAEFTKSEFHVSLPIAEDLKYDFVIEKNGVLCKVQARYTSKKNGVVQIKLRSIWANKTGSHVVNRMRGDYDILACYCPDTQKCYFVSDYEFDNGTSLTLRIDDVSMKSSFIRDAKQYESCDRAFEHWIRMQGETEEDIVSKAKIDVDEVLKLKKTQTWQDIGGMYGVSGTTIRSYLQSNGIDVSTCHKDRVKVFDPDYDKSILERVLTLLKDGKSRRTIAKELGLNRYRIDCMASYLVNRLDT